MEAVQTVVEAEQTVKPEQEVVEQAAVEPKRERQTSELEEATSRRPVVGESQESRPLRLERDHEQYWGTGKWGGGETD